MRFLLPVFVIALCLGAFALARNEKPEHRIERMRAECLAAGMTPSDYLDAQGRHAGIICAHAPARSVP